MKRKISIILLLIATLTFSLLAFTACGNDNDENGAKQVPVYQGMTITKSNSVLSLASYRMSGITLLSANNENNGDNGNHYGHYKGDHTDRNDTIDEDNPYPDNNANENIEEEIKSSLNVVGSPDEIYYATPNEDIYINIHIDNPDSFEIMSFTLNGKKYSSYMFEEGSDMETIVLKYNVGDATGIVEYTIDAIKYIDGTEIKDVIIDGNKTVMAGIRTENQVVASVTDVDIDTNVLSFNVNVKDNNSLVEFSKGALKAVIYDGFNIISEKDIAVGNNSVIFDGLKTNTVYQYAVVGYYDDLSGGGFGMNVLYKDAFYTDSVVLFDNITVGQESISFGYLWHEDHQGKAISALKLYKGDAFIKDITAGATTVNELLSGTTYKLVAEYPNADKTESIYLEFTTDAKAVPEISVHTPTSTQTSVGFTVTEADADNVGAVTKIELVHANGTTLADSLAQRGFVGLLSNNEYTVKVTYVYNLNDGTGDKTVVKELAAKTDPKSTPEINIFDAVKTQTSIGFEIVETDADNVGTVTKIELYKDGQLVETAANLDVRSFVGLLSNNTYTVKITYTYNLNDGTGNQTTEKNLNIKTNAKAVPIFTVKNENVTTDSVTAEYDIIDVDKILSYYKVELYKGNTLVFENADKKIDFTGLDYYTNYTVKITCTYDLNDGNGEQTKVLDCAFKTLPYIDVTECSIANTNAVSEGDTIFMAVKLDNPLGMKIESVVINGATYSVTGASTTNKIFVEIVYNGQFAGGDTYLKIDKVNAKIDDVTLTAIPETEFSDNVFINGKLEVLKIEFVNENFEPIDWAFPSDTVYVLITLNNPTGYIIDAVNTNVTELIKIDDNKWYYATTLNNAWNRVTLSSISYRNEYIRKTVAYSDIYANCYQVASDEIKYISTPSDLKNMEGGYYYELTKDIDLSGLEWLGGECYGVFDGKGYSIQNLSFVGTVKNTNARFGLFESGSGVITNVNIEDAVIISDVVADDGNDYDVFCGAFVADANVLTITQCSIDENSMFSVRNRTNGTVQIGGFVGRGYYTDIYIKRSQNASTVISDSSNLFTCAGGFVGLISPYSVLEILECENSGNVKGYYAGGILGFAGDFAYVGDTHVNVTNAVNTGIIEGANVGGIIGMVSNNSSEYTADLVIMNCISAGSIIANDFGGGLVSFIYSATTTIKNNIISSTITLISEHGYISDIAVALSNEQNVTVIEKCYSLHIISDEYCISCTPYQLNSKEFYTETLGWSEDVWDFSELDVENGKYPKLKQ